MRMMGCGESKRAGKTNKKSIDEKALDRVCKKQQHDLLQTHETDNCWKQTKQ